ncbi:MULTISPECIES: TerD family protein [Streptomyces]|uniref:TerD family protein n=1 Tax=Streptomyces TaxID=1883 RepID=UPI0003A52BF4|nr:MULTISPECIES: TerD family protein [Streptomyces]MBZ6108781.1 TerD family protein [Streptomyces olivaceus]MBZ6122665.1 TerD family protein [Streptomyces olivaceus]MBZ6143486.1 TerD family protein [Streptomyces olivaceus]MBZ6157326.1 TerD family protein [Streptomyces olivaceus]MBZ6185122.1 TerD family protein [Streptomyces olivaceus]
MAREFQRGHKARISDLTAGTDLYVGVQISGPGLTFDISCFGLDAEERLSDDRYFVFFNQPKTPEESIQLLGAQAGDTESFRVTLDRIPQQIQKLSFTATIDGAGQMSQVGPGYIRIVAGGEEVARYPFGGAEFSTERAVMLGDFYLKDVWRFAAVGQGFDGGLDALLKNFGGEVAEDEAPAPEQAQQPQGQAAPGFAPPAQATAPPAFGAPTAPAPAPAPAPQGFAPPPAAPQPPQAPAPGPDVHAAQTIVAPMNTPPGGAPVPPPATAPAPYGHPGQPGQQPPPYGQVPGQTAPPPPGYGHPQAPQAPQAPPPPPGYGLPTAPPGYGQVPGQPPPPPGYGQHAPQGVQQGMPPGAPNGMPTGAPQGAGVTAALQQFRETATGQRWTQQNKKLVRVDLGAEGQPVLARQGSMVLYQGKVDFSYKGAGFAGRVVGNATGQEMQLMRCTGKGQVFLADDSAMLHPIELQGDAVCVSAENVLAFDETLQYEVRRIEGHGIPGGALFTMQFQGTGTIVVKTRGVPVVLPVTPTTFADCNAVVAWSAAAQVVVSSQVRMRRNSYAGDTGESVNLQFRAAPGNFVVVQPYEI